MGDCQLTLGEEGIGGNGADLCPSSDAGGFNLDTGPKGVVPGSLPTVIDSNDDQFFSLGGANLCPSVDVEADLKSEGVCCRSSRPPSWFGGISDACAFASLKGCCKNLAAPH